MIDAKYCQEVDQSTSTQRLRVEGVARSAAQRPEPEGYGYISI